LLSSYFAKRQYGPDLTIPALHNPQRDLVNVHPARVPGPARDVVDQEGVFERRSGTFHSVAGRVKSPVPPSSVKRLAAAQVRAAYSGPA
jgi:hypothetical protein